MKRKIALSVLLSSALVMSCTPHNLHQRDSPQNEEPHIEVTQRLPYAELIKPLPYGANITIEPEITGDLEAKVDSILSLEIERFYPIAAKHLERRLKKYEPFINLAHEAYPNVPIDLIKAVAYAESNGNSRAISPKGARGLMQLMPGTAEDMGVPSGKRDDPYHSLMGGTRYLSDLMEKYQNNQVLVSIAYNQGPAIIDRYLERKDLLPSQVRWSSLVNLVKQETRDYVARVRAGRYAIETS